MSSSTQLPRHWQTPEGTQLCATGRPRAVPAGGTVECHARVFIVTEVLLKSSEEQGRDSCLFLFKLQFQRLMFQDQFSIKGVSSALCQTEKA